MEKTEFIVQIQLQGNNVDKVISVGVSPDEFENIKRAEKIGIRLIKRVEIIQETVLVSQVEQRVAQPHAVSVEPQSVEPPQFQFKPLQIEKEVAQPEQTFSSKFGKPTEPPTATATQQSQLSDDEIDKMITKPNEVNP
jgi:hypothetical protein